MSIIECPHCHQQISILVDAPHQRKTKEDSPYSPQFEAWWHIYPKKIGKGAAWKAWGQAIKRTRADNLITALVAQKETPQWKEQAGKYIPNPMTWLNQRRWDDAVPIPANDEKDIPRCLSCRKVTTGDKFCPDCCWCVKCDTAGKPSRFKSDELTFNANCEVVCSAHLSDLPPPASNESNSAEHPEEPLPPQSSTPCNCCKWMRVNAEEGFKPYCNLFEKLGRTARPIPVSVIYVGCKLFQEGKHG